MTCAHLQLRPLRVEDEPSFRSAVAEFAQETPPWGFAFDFDPSTPFSDYVAKLVNWSHGIDVPNHFVPNTYLVGMVDNVIVGRLSLRHRLNDSLARVGGHIGYGVVPSQRKRGYATEMLRQALPHCARLGIANALISCDEDNLASRKVIESNGGVFEGYTDCPDEAVQKRRYWIRIGTEPYRLP